MNQRDLFICDFLKQSSVTSVKMQGGSLSSMKEEYVQINRLSRFDLNLKSANGVMEFFFARLRSQLRPGLY